MTMTPASMTHRPMPSALPTRPEILAGRTGTRSAWRVTSGVGRPSYLQSAVSRPASFNSINPADAAALGGVDTAKQAAPPRGVPR
jgi:hypothetical protein